ncbi:hypothetical protein ACFW04_009068 [Cataglyphis niger]
MSESNDNSNVIKSEDEIITPLDYELEEKSDLQEEDNQQEEEKLQEDSFEDSLENYINYEERVTSMPARHHDKFLDRYEDENEIENKTKFLDQMWPTEKYTTYHLGGTRYWELDIMEPSVVFSITTKAIDIPITESSTVISITTSFTTKSKTTDIPVTEPSTVFSITTSFTTKSKTTDIPVTEPSVGFITDFTTKSKITDIPVTEPSVGFTTDFTTKSKTTDIPVTESSTVFSITTSFATKSKTTDIPVTEPSTVFSITTSFTTKSKVTDIPVTEPSVVFTTDFTTKSKAITYVTKTTCLYVVLKNEVNTDTKTKRNIHYHKRNVYNNETRKYISFKKQKIGLKNIRRKNMQNLRATNRYARRSGGKRKLDKFSRFSNEDVIIAKTRKLCSVNGNESKHQMIKHKDTMDTKNKTKKKQSTKSQKSQNINSRSPKSCTNNCIRNKKNSGKTITRTTVNHYSQAKNSNNKENKKVTNTDDHKKLSICTSRNKKNHNLNCICDIVNVIENIKSILNRISFTLDEIKTLNCSVYKETQDKIVISMDSDAEEAREFSQPHYNIESLKGQKYIKLEELEDDFKSDLELGNDHDIISLPGLNLNLPCNQDSDGITWLSSISRPSYAWKRTDGIAIFGFVAENGDLELRNVNAKDTGNYTCVTTYMGPESEEPVETTYDVHLQVVTLPRYIVHGENRYYTRSCDERDLDILVTYLPIKLNGIICEADICNAYILTPSCSRNQITVNILLLPSHIVKLITIDPKHCNVFCLKAIQDKLSLILSKNLQIFFGKTIPCNMGTYSEDGISYCKKCPSGTYQPNHGARVCRTCTDPLTKGCHNMLWSSFSAIMITLASIGVILSICLLFFWIICCAKKFCIKKIASIIFKNAFEQENPIEEQSLIKEVSENQDQQSDNEYKAKKKKRKFYLNKKRRKQDEREKYEKMRVHENEWGSHRIKNIPIICPDSYRSHEDYNNYYSKQTYRKGPRLPECDFDT